MNNNHYDSYVLLGDALANLGYSMETSTIAGKHVATYSKDKKKWITNTQAISYPSTYRFIGDIANNKSMAYEILGSAGVPIAFTHQVAIEERLNPDEVSRWISLHGKLVVKPERASLSHGLTLNLERVEDVLAAVEYARKWAKGDGVVLVQQQVYGEEVRFVCLGGNVTAALLRSSPKLTGDGRKTIEELVEDENESRFHIQDTMVAYPPLDLTYLECKGSLSDVLDTGEVIEVSKSTMIGGGASVYNVFDSVHDSNLAQVRKIVDVLGLGFVVIDMFIEDYTRPSKIYFNELNNSPVLKLFYSCRDGRHYDILPALAGYIDRQLEVR